MKTEDKTNNPTEKLLKETPIMESQEIKSKKGTVTMKTIKAWREQSERIAYDEDLLNKEEGEKLIGIMEKVKEAFIKNKF